MLKTYLKTAFRSLLRNRLLTFLNVIGLAVGITAFVLIFMWVRFELSFDRFHADIDNTYRIVNKFTSESEYFIQAVSGPAIGRGVAEALPSISAGMRITSIGGKVAYGEKVFYEENVLLADSNFFSFFSFPLLKGNSQQVLNARDRIVISEEMALKYFGNEDPIGKVLKFEEKHLLTVSGIVKNTPSNSQIQFDFVVPLDFISVYYDYTTYNDDWAGGWLNTYVKTVPGQGVGEVEKQVNEVIHSHLAETEEKYGFHYEYYMQPMKDIHLKSDFRYDYQSNGNEAYVFIFGTVGIFILLIAGINYVNLSTASSLYRAKETGIRKVSGASRSQLISQHLAESVLVSTLAIILSFGFFDFALTPFEEITDREFDFHYNASFIAEMIGFGLLVGLLAGIYPSLVISSYKPAVILKGNFKTSSRGLLLRKGLVIIQFVITIFLISSILIVQDQLRFIQNKDLGFKKEEIFNIHYRGNEKINRAYASLREELVRIPGILNASRHRANLSGGFGNGWSKTENEDGELISTSLYGMQVDHDYFDTHGIELAAGRFFSRDFPADTSQSLVVNEAAVRTFGWKSNESAVGKRFYDGEGEHQQIMTVIGVAKDFNFEGLRKPVEAMRIRLNSNGSNIAVRTSADNKGDVVKKVEELWKQRYPELPFEYSFLDQRINERYGSDENFRTVFLIFSCLSLVISCLGLFGLALFESRQRMKEISIRKVLGAMDSQIVILLTRGYVLLVAISCLISVPLAWFFMSKWLDEFAYRTTVNPIVFMVAAFLAIAVAVITVIMHALRASNINPAKTLRNE